MTRSEKPLADDATGGTATTRRRFTKTLTAAIVAAPLAAGAQTRNPTTKEPTAPPNPQPSPTPAAAPAQGQQKPSPLAEAYAEVARVRFGERLSPEEFARVKTDLGFYAVVADRLRAYKLKNADEPDFVFGA